jgi:hypothetical protein
MPVLEDRGAAPVNFTFFMFFAIVAVLVALLVWALRNPNRNNPLDVEPGSLEQTDRRHATYLPLIRRALSPGDYEFLASRGSPALARRVSKQRHRIALSYLAALHDDFLRLLRLAKVVAVLSPKVATAQEFERLWLSVQFSLRYHMLRAGLYFGVLSLPRLDALSHMVSELAVRMDTAMKELGERATLAAKMASSLDRSGLDAS